MVRCKASIWQTWGGEYEFRNGQHLGLRRRFQDGQLGDEFTIRANGQHEGLERSWAKNGQLVWEFTNDERGKTWGLRREWFRDGKLRKIEWVGETDRDGASVRYDPTGKITDLRCGPKPLLAPHVNDSKLCGFDSKYPPSTVNLYHSNGQLRSTVRTVFFANGKIEQEHTFDVKGKLTSQKMSNWYGKLVQDHDYDPAVQQQAAQAAAQKERALWLANNPRPKLRDSYPHTRTFVAKVPSKIISVGETDGALGSLIIFENGSRLKLEELMSLAKNPNFELPLPHIDKKQPRLVADTTKGADRYGAVLWSNGDMLGDFKLLNQERKAKRLRTGQFGLDHNDALMLAEAKKKRPTVLRDVQAIATGPTQAFTVVLRKNGQVHAFGGDNLFGHLGLNLVDKTGVSGFIIDNATAVAAGGRHGLALRKDGTVWMWGQDDLPYAPINPPFPTDAAQPTPRMVPISAKIIKVAAGGTSSYALTEAGEVWAWGRPDCGALGVGTSEIEPHEYTGPGIWWSNLTFSGSPETSKPNPTVKPRRITQLTNIVDIGAGANRGIALNRDGTVWGWGHNDDYLNGTPEFEEVPQYSKCHSAGHKTRLGWMKSEYPRPMRDMSNVKQIFAMSDLTLVVKSDNSLWAIGEAMSRYKAIAPGIR